MNPLTSFTHGVRERIIHIAFYRMKYVSVAVYVLSGIGALAVLYFLAYTVPSPAVNDQIVTDTPVAINQALLDKVTLYAVFKAQAAETIPVFPDAVFYVAPPSQ